MTQPAWAVLAAGDADAIEARVRAYFDDVDQPPTFAIARGSGHYHAVYGTRPDDFGREGSVAAELVDGASAPVYAIAFLDEPLILALQSGVPDDVVERDPAELAHDLGAPIPGVDSLPERPARRAPAVGSPGSGGGTTNVAMVEGATLDEVRAACALAYDGSEPPGHLQFTPSSTGVLLHSEYGDIGFADVNVSEQLPEHHVYTVTASPDLSDFTVVRMLGGAPAGTFSLPARHHSFGPTLDTIKGTDIPTAILAALGVPAELFR